MLPSVFRRPAVRAARAVGFSRGPGCADRDNSPSHLSASRGSKPCLRSRRGNSLVQTASYKVQTGFTHITTMVMQPRLYGLEQSEFAIYNPSRLPGISACSEIERDFAIGDRVQLTAPHHDLQVANRDLGTAERFRTWLAFTPCTRGTSATLALAPASTTLHDASLKPNANVEPASSDAAAERYSSYRRGQHQRDWAYASTSERVPHIPPHPRKPRYPRFS